MHRNMELVRGLHNLRQSHHGCVLTIGNFDGLHPGHRALISRARELAKGHGVPSALMTFEPTPREYFGGDEAPPRLAEFRGKLRLVERSGIDRMIVARFGRALSQMTAEDFVSGLLVQRLGVKAVVIGDDFRFGAKRAGDLAMLKRIGCFEAHGLASVKVGDVRCSSTAIREALARADLATASRLLGRPYSMIGRVRRGLRLGRKLGMPTANIGLHHRPALRYGIYAVRGRVGDRSWSGVANIGVRPTLAQSECLLEAHWFTSEPVDLYGCELEVEFSAFLRPEARFDSLEALAAQMQDDARRAREHFGQAANQ
jgi:riboflavin kinase/FMN adenylyltransferase